MLKFIRNFVYLVKVKVFKLYFNINLFSVITATVKIEIFLLTAAFLKSFLLF